MTDQPQTHTTPNKYAAMAIGLVVALTVKFFAGGLRRAGTALAEAGRRAWQAVSDRNRLSDR